MIEKLQKEIENIAFNDENSKNRLDALKYLHSHFCFIAEKEKIEIESKKRNENTKAIYENMMKIFSEV